MHWSVESSALWGLQSLGRAMQGNSAPEVDVILMTSALGYCTSPAVFPCASNALGRLVQRAHLIAAPSV